MLSILFPSTCHVCGCVLRKGVRHLCPHCAATLPFTGQCGVAMNPTAQRFLAVSCVDHAAGVLYYRPQSSSAQLLEAIKYGGYSRLAVWLGRMMGRVAADAGMLDGIDCVVPVPLHFMRRLRRGYNQSLLLADGLSEVTGIPVEDVMACRRHRTQTALTSSLRRANVEGTFRLKKHITSTSPQHNPPRVLLVDDVCTTGATLSAVAEALERVFPGMRMSILTLATTDR